MYLWLLNGRCWGLDLGLSSHKVGVFRAVDLSPEVAVKSKSIGFLVRWGATVNGLPSTAFPEPSMQAKTKGIDSGVDIGVKYSEKQERCFDDAKMKAGNCVIGLQVS